MDPDPSAFITLKKAGDILGVSPLEVQRRATTGQLDSVEHDGRLMVSAVDVMDMADSR